jgi:antitoxin HicB
VTLSYPARLVPTDDGLVIARFPDVPEASAVGKTEEEALAGAVDVLDAVLGGYVLDGRPIPAPSDICGAPQVETEKFSLLGLEVRGA